MPHQLLTVVESRGLMKEGLPKVELLPLFISVFDSATGSRRVGSFAKKEKRTQAARADPHWDRGRHRRKISELALGAGQVQVLTQTGCGHGYRPEPKPEPGPAAPGSKKTGSQKHKAFRKRNRMKKAYLRHHARTPCVQIAYFRDHLWTMAVQEGSQK